MSKSKRTNQFNPIHLYYGCSLSSQRELKKKIKWSSSSRTASSSSFRNNGNFNRFSLRNLVSFQCSLFFCILIDFDSNRLRATIVAKERNISSCVLFLWCCCGCSNISTLTQHSSNSNSVLRRRSIRCGCSGTVTARNNQLLVSGRCRRRRNPF